MYTFLAALPAILGLLGFVIFLFFRNKESSDAVTPMIIEKLRAEHPERFKDHQNLTSTQLHSLLKKDQDLQKQVGKQDFKLLEQTLKQQHTQSILVYCITAGLFIIGTCLFVYQVNKTVPTKISNIQLDNTITQSQGFLVDLDDLRITWQFSGEEKEVTLYAENLDTQVRSEFWSAISTDGELVIKPRRYKQVISSRLFGESNRIRIMAQADEKIFRSQAYNINVGATIIAVVFDDDERLKIASMIDNTLVDGYQFEAKLVAPKRDELDFFSVDAQITGAQDFPVDTPNDYDWANAKIVYLGPDDSRLFKTDIIYDN